MGQAGSASRVFFDASPFHRFAEAGQLVWLAGFFQKRRVPAEITCEVRDELVTAGITTTLTMMNWPTVVELPSELKAQALRRMRASQAPGDHKLKNSGEISTALYARHVGAVLVVGEDALLKAMCDQEFGVPRISTAKLVVEMVSEGDLTYADGWRTWDAATPASGTDSVFRKRLSDAGYGHVIPR